MGDYTHDVVIAAPFRQTLAHFEGALRADAAAGLTDDGDRDTVVSVKKVGRNVFVARIRSEDVVDEMQGSGLSDTAIKAFATRTARFTLTSGGPKGTKVNVVTTPSPMFEVMIDMATDMMGEERMDFVAEFGEILVDWAARMGACVQREVAAAETGGHGIG